MGRGVMVWSALDRGVGRLEVFVWVFGGITTVWVERSLSSCMQECFPLLRTPCQLVK